MHSVLLHYIMLGLGVLALSSSAVFVKLAHAPASITAFYRLLFAALLLLPAVVLVPAWRRALCALTSHQCVLGLLSGIFLAVHYVLWFESLNYTSVASSTVIVSLQPLFSLFGGWLFFKERFSRRALAGCVVAITGSFIIGWGDFQLDARALWGDLLAFAAAGIITVYFFIGQHLRRQLPAIPYSLFGYTASAVFLACYSLYTQVSFTAYPLHTWQSFLGLAFFATILGQVILNWLLKWLGASVISMSILGETIGTCLLAYIILHEVISWWQGIGIIMILSGLAAFFLGRPTVSET